MQVSVTKELSTPVPSGFPPKLLAGAHPRGKQPLSWDSFGAFPLPQGKSDLCTPLSYLSSRMGEQKGTSVSTAVDVLAFMVLG